MCISASNKTLAAQLCNEFRELLPEAAVEYFVSYYDYYQPEAYIAATDTYIEKDSSINDEIDRLRHSATAALLARRDVVTAVTYTHLTLPTSLRALPALVHSLRLNILHPSHASNYLP